MNAKKTLPDEEFQLSRARASKPGKLPERRLREIKRENQSKYKIPFGKTTNKLCHLGLPRFPQRFLLKAAGRFPFARFEEWGDVYSRRRCLFKVPNLFGVDKLNPGLCLSSELV